MLPGAGAALLSLSDDESLLAVCRGRQVLAYSAQQLLAPAQGSAPEPLWSATVDTPVTQARCCFARAEWMGAAVWRGGGVVV